MKKILFSCAIYLTLSTQMQASNIDGLDDGSVKVNHTISYTAGLGGESLMPYTNDLVLHFTAEPPLLDNQQVAPVGEYEGGNGNPMILYAKQDHSIVTIGNATYPFTMLFKVYNSANSGNWNEEHVIEEITVNLNQAPTDIIEKPQD